MKIFLGIILVCFSTLLGYILSAKFTFRKEFYNDFYNFNNKLKQEISFRQTTLIALVKTFSNTDFNLTLKSYIENSTFSFNKNYLKKDEIEYFSNYLKTIGAGDKSSQLDFLDKSNVDILEKQKQTSDEEKKYKILYIKLSFLLGLILFVLVL